MHITLNRRRTESILNRKKDRQKTLWIERQTESTLNKRQSDTGTI